MTTKVFENEKELMKEIFKKEADNFCDMLDCVEEPPALDYKIEVSGVRIRITAELIK